MSGCSKTEGCEMERKETRREAIRPGKRVSDWLTNGSGRLSGGSRLELVKRRQLETM
jgi:hypothetical protein